MYTLNPHVNDQLPNLEKALAPAGTKVWPVKGAPLAGGGFNTWCTGAEVLDQDVLGEQFMPVPNSTKFSKFIEQNNKGRSFVIALFSAPIHDPSDKPNVMTLGFVFDVMKAKTIAMKTPVLNAPPTHSVAP